MLFYDIRMALKSLRRNPILSALSIGAIALGICVSTTFIALRHSFEKDPMPGGSQTIFNVRMDSWDPQRAYIPDDPRSLPQQLTYRDVRGLMQSNIPLHQGGTATSRMFVFPDPKVGRPFSDQIRLVFSDFFPMFAIPFEYGGPWSKAGEAKPEQVVVIDHAMNQRLFGGANSIGRPLRIGDRDFKVVGVISKDWRPSYRYYDLTQSFKKPESIFMPFNFIPVLQLFTSGNMDGWVYPGDGFERFLTGEYVWIQYWVELPTVEKQQAYGEFVDNYIRDQKRIGRFKRPLHKEVTALTDLLTELGLVPRTVRSMSIVSFLFLVVCSLNLVGLLLGKFLARIPEVSVRRALGASRLRVFLQHVVECEVIGIAGGTIGLALSMGLLKVIAKTVPNSALFARLDAEMIVVSVFLSLVAGLVAGIYPSWRVCSIAPAMQLKLQ